MFFNPLSRASTDPNYKVLATAQMTITDQTDASNLAGNMTVVNGSKSQTYLTGSNQPYSPNWKVNNLVLRPYMIATNIYREDVNRNAMFQVQFVTEKEAELWVKEAYNAYMAKLNNN